MRGARAVTTTAGAALAFASWVGCTIWNDAEPPSTDAGVTVEPTADAAREDDATTPGCAREAIDARAPEKSLGTGGDLDIVVAIKTIALGGAEGKVDRDFGYDLDGVCTASCVSGGGGGAGGDDAGDGNLGRDNGMGVMLAGLPIPNPAIYANEGLAAGDIGILARVQNYNGEPNDDDVLFSLYRTTRPEGVPPNFDDPNQAWRVDTTDLKTGAAGDDYTSNTEGRGFVRNGQLIVAGLASSKIPFNGDSDIRLQRVSFVADLVEDKAIGRWTLKNAIGVGRWDVVDALQTIAHVQDPTDSKQRICQNPFLLEAARKKVCSSTDLNLNSDDGAAACNALSAAVKFETVPAKLGKKETPEREEACAGVPIGGCE